MRTVRSLFARNAEFGRGQVNPFGEVGELRARLNSDPEYAWSFCRGEESVTCGENFELAAFDPPQTLSDGVDPLRWLFSDELQRNVQRLRTHPAGFGCKALNAFEKALDPGTDRGVEIDADEYSHLFITVACNGALQQRPADHLQRLLRCELADAFAVTEKIALDDLGAFFSGKRDVNEPYGL